MEVPPELEAKYNEYYDTVRTPANLLVPGCIFVRRYYAVEGSPKRLEDSRQVGPRASHAACCPDHLAQHCYHGLPTSPLRGYRTPCTQSNLLESRPHCPFPLPLTIPVESQEVV